MTLLCKFTMVSTLTILSLSTIIGQEITSDLRIKIEEYQTKRNDTSKLIICLSITRSLNEQAPLQGIAFSDSCIYLAELLNSDYKLADALNKKGFGYYRISNYDSAFHYMISSRDLYKDIGDSSLVSFQNNNIGGIHLAISEYEKAFEYISIAHDSYLRNNDKKGEVLTLFNFGLLYDYLENYPVAIDYFQKTLRLAITLKDTTRMAQCFFEIGLVNYYIENFELALENYQKALEIFERLDRPIDVADLYQNIALLYDIQKQHNKAFYYHFKSLELDTMLGLKSSIADDYNNLGVLYKKFEDSLNVAEEYILKGLRLKKEVGSKEKIISGLLNLGDLYLRMKKIGLAKFNLREAYNIANEIGHLGRLKEVNEALKEYYKEVGNFNLAFKHSEEFKLYNDSLFNKEIARQVYLKQINSEIEKAKAQKDRDAEVIKRKELWVKALSGAIFLGSLMIISLGVISFLIFRQSKERNRINQLLSKKNKKIETLHRELSHRVKNNLAFISSLMRMQGRRLINEEAKRAVKEGENRIQAMSLIHRRLYYKESDIAINLGEYLKELCMHLKNSYLNGLTSSAIRIQTEKIKIDAESAIRLGLIVNELVTNSLKHAFPKQSSPKMQIRVRNNNASKFRLTYQDNGIGLPLPIDINATNSLGLKLILSLTKQLNGKVEIQNKDGAFFQFDFENKNLVI